MAELKTKVNSKSVTGFLRGVKDKQRRDDCLTVLKLMKQATKAEPRMWGTSIVGFGTHRYKSPATGREGDWFPIGFSPRAQNLTLYFVSGFGLYADLMAKLGKHSTGMGCLYVKKLDDISIPVLKQLMKKSIADSKRVSRQNTTTNK